MTEKEKIVFRKITSDFSNLEIKSFVTENGNIYDSIPHPFLKWAGGKRQLLSQMDQYFPLNIKNYIEPFVGGGAVFFHLYKKGLLINSEILLIDINSELVNVYSVIQNNVFELIELLKDHKNENNYYYKIRALDRDPAKYKELSKIARASRIIYLNRCCYNGLYRVNSKGQFNVPFGKYKNPKFCDDENLKGVSKSLRNVKILHASFEKCLEYAQKGDFIYFDPPYHPISKTSSFTSYTKQNFGEESQMKLFNVFKKLDEKGCKIMLSNSYTKFIKKLYKDYEILTLDARRVINCDAERRGNIEVSLVLNY